MNVSSGKTIYHSIVKQEAFIPEVFESNFASFGSHCVDLITEVAPFAVHLVCFESLFSCEVSEASFAPISPMLIAVMIAHES